MQRWLLLCSRECKKIYYSVVCVVRLWHNKKTYGLDGRQEKKIYTKIYTVLDLIYILRQYF